jgi:hypothetical protein
MKDKKINAKFTICVKCAIYVNHPKKTRKGELATSQGGLSEPSQL